MHQPLLSTKVCMSLTAITPLSLFIEFGEPNASIACRLGRCSQQHNFILFRVFCIVFYRVCLCLAEHERECNSVIIHEH